MTPLYLRKCRKMRKLYCQIKNEHAFKPHGTNIWTIKLVLVLFLAVEVHRGTKIHYSKKGEKETKNTLAMVPTYPRFTIINKIETKAMHVTSLTNSPRSYGANEKTEFPWH